MKEVQVTRRDLKTYHLFEDKICSKEATVRGENGDDDTHSLQPLLFAMLIKTFVSALARF